MASKMLLFSAIFAVVALLSVDARNDILCSRDKTIRELVVECIALMPSQRFEIIKECDSRLLNVQEGEYEKLLDVFCAAKEERSFREVGECITKAYKTRGIDESEHIRPVTECMDKIVTKP